MFTWSRSTLYPVFGLMLITLNACDSGDDSINTPYNRDDLKATMKHLDQQAYVIWGNSGSEWDAEGWRELYPTTDEGWAELVVAGQELVNIGKQLKGKVDKEDPRAEAWDAYADGISQVSQKLIVAAETQDKQATFDEGGVLYQVCTACHGTFPAPPEVEANRP